MSDNVIYIPGRVKSMVKDGHAVWAEDIYDDNLNKTQESINEETVGTTGSSLSSRVSTLEGQVAFEGAIEVEDNPANVVAGNGKVTSANAVAGAISAALMTIDEEPTEDSENAVSSGGVYDALQRKYEKPVAGIPSTDMIEGVQTALSKANTAIQRDDIADLVTEQGMTLYVEEALQPVVTLIPTQATPTNQLADKDFVNSSIATSTGTFRGTYQNWSQIEAISDPKLNDYVFLETTVGSTTTYDRYKYTTTGWEFEYRINNSSFTAAQWAAINSQATQELTAKLSALPSASELNTELGGKQDVINDLNDIRSGAALGATAVQTETDPTVPAWAKQQSKPSYSYSEIQNTPTNVSAFTNDVPYVTESEMVVPSADANGHEYVDLGLPSGTLWATCNVGASAPEGYGNYYMYGYTTPYDDSDTPYSGTEDPLSLEHDAARVNWGGDWRMPTKAQMEELIANTTYEWATINGINGGKFTAQNGNYVFFPAAGFWDGGRQILVGENGNYWSSSPIGSGSASNLFFGNRGNLVDKDTRQDGCSVRGVLSNSSYSPKYATKQELNSLSSTVSGKAEKSEMSVTPGADADKTTIQLKTGTSATVLTQHQDISGKANKSEMSVTPGTGTDADKTTIQLKSGTSATVLTAHQDISNLIASQSVRNVVVLTQQEYDALATKDNYTEYNIV